MASPCSQDAKPTTANTISSDGSEPAPLKLPEAKIQSPKGPKDSPVLTAYDSIDTIGSARARTGSTIQFNRINSHNQPDIDHSPPPTTLTSANCPRTTSQSFIKRNFSSAASTVFGKRSFSGETTTTSSSVTSSSRNSSFGFAVGGDRSGPSTAPNSPEIQAMLGQEQKDVPDLQSVISRALEAAVIGEQGDSREQPECVRIPTPDIKAAQDDYKKLLTRAMQERSRGNVEICRAGCMEIVRSRTADVETQVYAYNILSTQASAGQAGLFLDLSEYLVRRHSSEHPELEKLAGVLAALRQRIGNGRVERHCGSKNGQSEQGEQRLREDDEGGLQMKRNAIGSKASGTSSTREWAGLGHAEDGEIYGVGRSRKEVV